MPPSENPGTATTQSTKQNCTVLLYLNYSQWRIQDFPHEEVGANPRYAGKNLFFCKIFAENCMKIDEIVLRGGARSLATLRFSSDFCVFILFIYFRLREQPGDGPWSPHCKNGNRKAGRKFFISIQAVHPFITACHYRFRGRTRIMRSNHIISCGTSP